MDRTVDRETRHGLSRRNMVQILATAPLLLPASQALGGLTAGSMAAFIVGIDNYASLKPLTRAVADAKAMAAKLTSYGYDVTLVTDPDIGALVTAQNQFLEKLSVGNMASFCYFAGHGVQYGARNFLLATDTELSSADTMLERAMPLDTLMQDVARQRPTQSIIVSDACRDAVGSETLTGQGTGFAAAAVPNGFYVVYTAGTGEVAVDNLGENDRDPNGLFARNLLKRISPTQRFDDLVQQARAEVVDTAWTIGRRQNPSILNQARGRYHLDPKRPETPTSILGDPLVRGRTGSTSVLLIGVDHYPNPTLAALVTPSLDVSRLAETFDNLGAKTTQVKNVDPAGLLKACEAVAAEHSETIIVYFAGFGGWVGADGAIFMPTTTPDVPAPFSADPDVVGIAVLTLGQLLPKLLPPGPPATPQGQTRGFALAGAGAKGSGPTVILLIDSCVDEVGVHAPKAGVSLIDMMKRDERWSQFKGVGLVYATGLMQQALDAAEGQSSSPFTIALGNALARPGLTLAQFTSLVRAQVEEITHGFQTPILLCSEDMRDFVMVEPA